MTSDYSSSSGLRIDFEIPAELSGLRVTDIAWSPNGKYLALGTYNNCIIIWDYFNRKTLYRIGLPRIIAPSAGNQNDRSQIAFVSPPCLTSAWSPEGEVLAYVVRFNRVSLFDTKVDLPPENCAHEIPIILRLAWIGKGTEIAAADASHLWFYDVSGSRPPSRVHHLGFLPNAMEASPCLQKIAISSYSGVIRVLEIRGDEVTVAKEFEDKSGPSLGVAWCPRTHRLAGCQGEGRITVWDSDTWKEVASLTGHSGPCLSVVFSSSGDLLASKSVDGTVRLWDCESWLEVAEFQEKTDSSFGRISFHPEEPLLATRGDNDRGIKIWRIQRDNSTNQAYGALTPSSGLSPLARMNINRLPASIPIALTAAISEVLELPRNDRRPKCFLSYARGKWANERRIEDMAFFLKNSAEIDVLFDRWHNPPGSSITKFFDGLRESEFVLPIGSPEYRAKYLMHEDDPIVDAEIRIIQTMLRKNKGTRERVLPILIDGDISTSFPDLFHDSVIVDCRSEGSTATGLFELVARIHGIDFSSEKFIQLRRALETA